MKPASLLVALLLVCSSCDSGNPDPIILPSPKPEFVADSSYTVTASGLKYFDLVVGDTARVTADSGDVVLIDYHAWLEDETIFDSSILAGQPIQFSLGIGNVIAGLDTGISGMYLGGVRQVIIPPELGYGEEGNDVVPPNETLTFEIALLGAQ